MLTALDEAFVELYWVDLRMQGYRKRILVAKFSLTRYVEMVIWIPTVLTPLCLIFHDYDDHVCRRL